MRTRIISFFVLVYERSRILLEEDDGAEDDFETANKVRRYYQSCINESRLEERGVAPLQESLKVMAGSH